MYQDGLISPSDTKLKCFPSNPKCKLLKCRAFACFHFHQVLWICSWELSFSLPFKTRAVGSEDPFSNFGHHETHTGDPSWSRIKFHGVVLGSGKIKKQLESQKSWWFTRWWFQIFFIFTRIMGRFPIWLLFFRWVETTNQFNFGSQKVFSFQKRFTLQVNPWDFF